MNFSVALIARNESKTLPRLVESLSEFQKQGGEILLLDTGSTDGTADVARSLGCIVHEVGDKFRINIDKTLADSINKLYIVDDEQDVVKEGESMFDFASARNYIADFANNDMLMTPDCDEIWTKLDLERIQKEIENGAEQFEYNFVFSHDNEGRPVIQFMHSKFYNRKKLKWVGIIHEVLSGNAKRVYLDESIIKLEHYQNVETNRGGYLKGLAYDCYMNRDNDRNSHYFAREMMYKGRFKSAIKEFERHIAMNRWQTEASQSMLYIGDCYKYLGNIDEMMKWYLKSLDKEPRREPLMRLAEHYYKQGKHQQTIIYAEGALALRQLPFYSNFQPYYEHLPHEFLYVSYWWTGDKGKSKEHYDIAVAFNPTNPKYIQDREFYYSTITSTAKLPTVKILIPTLNRPEGLERCLKSVKALNYPVDSFSFMVNDGAGTVPQKIKEMVEQAPEVDYYCYGADDTEFTPDSLKIAIQESIDNKKGLVAFNTGKVLPDEGNICEHFIIRKDLLEKIGGEIFSTKFNHVGVDNLLWAKCKKLGETYRSEKAIIHHYHFSQGAKIDSTYEKGWSKVDEDRKKLLEELAII